MCMYIHVCVCVGLPFVITMYVLRGESFAFILSRLLTLYIYHVRLCVYACRCFFSAFVFVLVCVCMLLFIFICVCVYDCVCVCMYVRLIY